MKDPLERTKVVLRHLPPSLTEPALTEQIEDKFSGRYKWFFFRPGKSSPKNGRYARAYIDFKSPADVFEFAEFFDGHVFVNEKGTQFKVLVEYAPSQSIPSTWIKKDGREGSIFKDPDYLEFVELLAKPTENLPSAEIQLERRESERSGAKEAPIITPLMDFVRRRRAAKSGSQRAFGNGKPSRRALVGGNSSSPSSRRCSEKRRGPSLKYISKDSTKNGSGKEKPTYMLVTRRDEQRSEKPPKFPFSNIEDDIQDETGTVTNGIVSGVSVAVETGKRALLLLKGKEREGSHIQRLEVPGRIIKSILSKEGNQVSASQPDHQFITVNIENDKRPPRPPVQQSNLKDHASSSLHTFVSDADGKSHKVDKAASSELYANVSIRDNKIEKRMRNKDRPDRGVWAPLHRSDVFQGHVTNFLPSNEIGAGHRNKKFDTPGGNRSSESKRLGVGRGHHASLDNGVTRHAVRRGMTHGSKDLDVSASTAEAKPSKRGPIPYEKQVWVQKNGSAS
ncbi:regulator of nonsense transcripts UPF3 [Dendrobium catenatum]|uniref:Regulator of nonsense transcripts UPF3 n=1 Tax=Dendrobium catenatum TaxID=906689 RepID=A0A2I0X275_9ASPA|nr:regulator of nonsense transcripts UPF3 [Dendrobium catenatum]PKU82009.1 Regulator of nonsense transcripts UPF3 [Dendrobium catenatum]